MSDDPHRGKITSSKVASVEACGSNLVRSVEMNDFTERMEIDSLSDLMAEDRFSAKGTLIHDVLSQFPVFIKTWDLGKKVDYGELLDRIIEKNGLDEVLTLPDRSYIRRAVRTRDELIEQWAESIQNPKEVLSLKVDNHRLTDEFYQNPLGNFHERSGLSDFSLKVIDTENKAHVLILDYKSGWQTEDNSENSVQNESNAALERMHDPKVVDVAARLITRDNSYPVYTKRDGTVVGETLQLVWYDQAKLQKAIERWDRVCDEATVMLDRYNEVKDHFSETEFPSKEIEAKVNDLKDELHDKASVGNHCKFCDGKLCCTKFQEKMRQDLPKIQAMHAKIAAISEKGAKMNIDELKYSMGLIKLVSQASALAEKAGEEAKALSLAIYQKKNGYKVLGEENFDVRKGRASWSVPEGITPREAAKMMAEAYPNKIKQGEFLDNVCKPTGRNFREYMMDVLDCNEDQVLEMLNEKFGEKSPLVKTEGDPSLSASKKFVAELSQEISSEQTIAVAKPRPKVRVA